MRSKSSPPEQSSKTKYTFLWSSKDSKSFLRGSQRWRVYVRLGQKRGGMRGCNPWPTLSSIPFTSHMMLGWSRLFMMAISCLKRLTFRTLALLMVFTARVVRVARFTALLTDP